MTASNVNIFRARKTEVRLACSELHRDSSSTSRGHFLPYASCICLQSSGFRLEQKLKAQAIISTRIATAKNARALSNALSSTLTSLGKHERNTVPSQQSES
jgi:hypothetical protein